MSRPVLCCHALNSMAPTVSINVGAIPQAKPRIPRTRSIDAFSVMIRLLQAYEPLPNNHVCPGCLPSAHPQSACVCANGTDYLRQLIPLMGLVSICVRASHYWSYTQHGIVHTAPHALRINTPTASSTILTTMRVLSSLCAHATAPGGGRARCSLHFVLVDLPEPSRSVLGMTNCIWSVVPPLLLLFVMRLANASAFCSTTLDHAVW